MPSSTFSVRMNAELLERIKLIAETETRTVNQQIVYFIEKGLARYEAEKDYLRGMDDVPNDGRLAK
jgi:hypothetical protein